MLGHPIRLEIEHTIDQGVPRAEHDDLVAAIERFMRLEGRTSETPGGLVWRSGGKLGETLVELIAWRGGTKIRLASKYWDSFIWMVLGVLLVGWMPGLVVVAGLELGPSPGAIAVAVGYVATYIGARALWHAIGRDQESGLMALLERVIEHAELAEQGLETVAEHPPRRRTVRRTAADQVAVPREASVGGDGPAVNRQSPVG